MDDYAIEIVQMIRETDEWKKDDSYCERIGIPVLEGSFRVKSFMVKKAMCQSNLLIPERQLITKFSCSIDSRIVFDYLYTKS